jgi:hypothetical protein
VLDPDQLQSVAETFGVDESQVLRDHLISHLLAAISAEAAAQVVFFGGTALARSLIPDGRLSEDIDLIATGTRTAIAQRLTTALPRALRREFPGLTWQPAPVAAREPAPAILRNADGLGVGGYRLQLPGLAWFNRTSAMVTAHGTTSSTCKIETWRTSGTGTAVDVRCRTNDGTPADSSFTLSYLTNF